MDTSQTIMIVDDTEMNIAILVEALQDDYEVIVAINGSNAIELLEDQKPDLILLDIMMPGMNGYDVCQRIKANVRFKNIPIIFISALNESFDKVKAFKMGGSDYITKPFQMEEVMARVGTHLKIAQSRKEIKDLYSKTLQGMIQAMYDIVAIASPEVSRFSNAMQLYAEVIMRELSIKDSWDLKLACKLSGLGLLTEAIEKSRTKNYTNTYNSIDIQNRIIAFEINKVYESLSSSIQVIENIPKFEPVVKILKNSMSPLDKTNINTPISNLEPDILKGHILRILINFIYKIMNKKRPLLVLNQMMNSQEEFYLYAILKVLYKVE